MIYLDSGATSFRKPPQVSRAVQRAMVTCASPGRGGYPQAMQASRVVFSCRELAGRLFDCEPEQVVFTSNCTQGLNMAIRSLIKPGDRVVISGFEHNAVTRPLYGLGAKITVAGRKLFDWDDTLEDFEKALKQGANAAVFTHVSNVFGYILPVEELAGLCRAYGVPFILDAAQSAGTLSVRLGQLGAAYIAMPGHKGLLGPQGTGMLLCGAVPEPLILGGTGSDSLSLSMPDWLPDRAEAGTLNVPGIAGLLAGMQYLDSVGMDNISKREHAQLRYCAGVLKRMGLKVFQGPHQAATLSFVPGEDCEEFAEKLSRHGIAVRGGFHCARLAHESAGTLETGTVRISFGYNACYQQSQMLIKTLEKILM